MTLPPDAAKLGAQEVGARRQELDRDGREFEMRKVFEIGGIVAAAVLVAFGIASIFMGVNGRSTVRDSLKLEQIVGSADMTPAGITAEAKKAGLKTFQVPSKSVAGLSINTGDRARAFAGYMRIHALEATGGLTYSQMGRFTAKPGTPTKFTDGHGATSIDTYAALDPKTQRPVDNGLRNLWVTETALTTALNTSFMAEQISLFGIVVGIALLLAGIGFAILAIGGALRTNVLGVFTKSPRMARQPAVPTA
jgi:hypothetical protein